MAHSEETRQSVIAALLTGQGVNEVARAYKLPKATVSRIKNELTPQVLEQIGTQKRDEIGDMLGSYVRTNLETLKVQSEHFRDKDWLKRQSASEIAVLHGVIADKTIRILEAAQFADSAADD